MTFGGGFGGETVAHDVFRDNTRDEEVEEVIVTTGFGAAATHFESAKGMTADHGAGAGAIDVNVPRNEFGFDPLDVGRTAKRTRPLARNRYRWQF